MGVVVGLGVGVPASVGVCVGVSVGVADSDGVSLDSSDGSWENVGSSDGSWRPGFSSLLSSLPPVTPPIVEPWFLSLPPVYDDTLRPATASKSDIAISTAANVPAAIRAIRFHGRRANRLFASS